MLSIGISIRQFAWATSFVVLGVLPSMAGVIQVTASGGPGAGPIGGFNSVLLEVVGSANVIFDSNLNEQVPICTPIDSSQPYSCSGGNNFQASFTGPGLLQTVNEIGGPYEDLNGNYLSNIFPNDFCNGNFTGSGTTCALTLGAGTYLLSAEFSDDWQPVTNAIAGLLSAESETATLTINSGNVFIVPEPTTKLLALLGGVFLSALVIRFKLYKPSV
jgi:hypothetical protein